MEIPDWRRLNEHLVNTRGPLVYIYIHNGRDEQDGLQTLVYKPIVYKGV